MSAQDLDFTLEGRVGRLVLRRAAFTGDMLRQMLAMLLRAQGEADILVLSSSGNDFSLGRDRQEPRSGPPFDAFRLITDVNAALAAFPGISVALVRGRAFGFAVGMILRTDIAIAAEDARFSLDEVKLGIPPMFVMAEIVEHLAPKAAADIVFSSREFGAGEAREFGIVSRVVAAAGLASAGEDLVAALRERNPEVLRESKSYLRAVKQVPPAARGAYALVEQTRFAERARH